MAANALSMGTAIMQTMAYSDIFDYPLTVAELHRYLVAVRVPRSCVEAALDSGQLVPKYLERRDGYLFLPGRGRIVETRLRRAAVAAAMWPRAERYGGVISRLPFVRMVAVTGALAMDNVDPNTDIDYLIVTEPGRLWLCRALVVAIVQLARRFGDTICPNYFLSDRALSLGRENLFTAHELAQMVPITGLSTYYRMCEANRWAAAFLPNAFGLPRRAGSQPHSLVPEKDDPVTGGWRYPRLVAEGTLRTPVGSWLERWEMERKVRKLTRQMVEGRDQHSSNEGHPDGAEIAFSADRCKGHFDEHGRSTITALNERLRSLASARPMAGRSLDYPGGLPVSGAEEVA